MMKQTHNLEIRKDIDLGGYKEGRAGKESLKYVNSPNLAVPQTALVVRNNRFQGE
jgi:hypothetical protein